MNLILGSDWHIRDDTPACRVDDFMATQQMKLMTIADYARKRNAAILFGGDLYHRARPVHSQMLVILFMEIFKGLKVYAVPGNHDLPGHNRENLNRSALGVLVASGAVQLIEGGVPHGIAPGVSLYGFGWTEDIMIPERVPGEKRIVVSHQMVLDEPMPFGGIMADQLIHDVDADLILTGDNHQRIIRERDGRYLINPGCFTRQTANQIEAEPGFYIFDTDSWTYEFVGLVHAQDAVTEEHLAAKEEREDRIEAFVERMNTNYEVGMSFEKNLRAYLESNEVAPAVRDIVWEVVA